MKEQERQEQKGTKQTEKRIAEDAKNLAREQQIKKDYLAKEQLLEEATKAKENERAQQRDADNIKELKREKVRKEAYLAKEKTIASDQEARNPKIKIDRS